MVSLSCSIGHSIRFIVDLLFFNLKNAFHRLTDCDWDTLIDDPVGFNSDGQDLVGIVHRLNHKTATVHTHAGQKWRVSYS